MSLGRLIVVACSALIIIAGTLICGSYSSHAQTAATTRFRDVAANSRFSYVTRNDDRGRKYFIQPMCGGVAIFDYDNDGKPDILFTNGAELPSFNKSMPAFSHCLLRNRGEGNFEDRTQAAGLTGAGLGYSLGVAAGDYDNDGFPDLFIANAGENALFHNNRDGTFTNVTAQSGLTGKPPGTLSVGAAWFDYDRDGLLDVLVSNYTVWTPETDQRCVDPLRGELYCSPTKYTSVPDRLYRNLGNGKFEDVTDHAGLGQARGKGMGISIADINNDGFPDVFVVNDTERNFLFINQRDGTFREEGTLYGISYNDDGVTVNGMGSDAKDFNNDGYVDFFYNDLPHQVFALFAGQGRSFRYMSDAAGLGKISYAFGGWSAGFVDYDNDGWKDIYSANGDVDRYGDDSRQSDTLFRNIEGKAFRDVSSSLGLDFTRKGFHRGAAFGDLNNDGALDIVVTGLNERPRILMNSGAQGAHWLLLDLQGTGSNRDAISAAIKLTTGTGRTLYNHVSVSTGFMSSSDKRVHFGLGPEKVVRSIEIKWPGGREQKITNPAIDRILKIVEPEH